MLFYFRRPLIKIRGRHSLSFHALPSSCGVRVVVVIVVLFSPNKYRCGVVIVVIFM
jgi:hypothetical protein